MSILRLLALLLVLASATTAAFSQGIQVYRLRDSFYPGSSGNQVVMRIKNVSDIQSPEFVPRPQLPLQWIGITSIAPKRARLAPGQSQDFVMTFDVAAAAPAGSATTASVFFLIGQGIPAARFDLVVDFAGPAAAAAANPELKELEFVDIEDSFKAGTVGNAVVFKVQNTTAFPAKGLNLRPELPARYLTLDKIEPKDIDLDPGKSVNITAWFSVRADAEVGGTDVIGFHFDTVSDNPIPIPRYRLKATIKPGDPVATCNSAVDSGGDAGGGVEVDLGDFTGKAGFTWEMYDIKDQMDVTVGGQSKTTGCVSGSGTFEFDVPAGARTATVKVKPNCEATSGTSWNFKFECPLASTVTTDGAGNPADGGSNPPGDTSPPGVIAAAPGVSGPPGQLAPATPRPSAPGNPVVPAPPAPPAIPASGIAAAETEDNSVVAAATPVAIGSTVTGTISQFGDGDNFAVQIAWQGELTVAFPSVPPGIDIAFRVLDAAGREIRGWQVGGGWVDLATPGNYVIEVRDGNNDAFSAAPYAMETSFIPTADPAEPNDIPATATPLDWNHAVRGNILPFGDADIYAVKADRMGQLTVAFRQTAPALDMTFRVLAADGREIAGWQTASQGGLHTGIADLPAPGPYLIEVRDGNNDARSAVPYELVASFDPVYDGGEANDSLATSTIVAFGAQVWANILPFNDADFYAVDVPRQGELAVGFNASPPELDMAFRVLASDGTLVQDWRTAPAAGQRFGTYADLKTAGRYVIEVRDGNNNARSSAPYGLVMAHRPTDDTAEPNDGVGSATPVALGDMVAANILPMGDSDYYRFTARGDKIVVNFSRSPATLNMAFRVLAADGREITAWQAADANGKSFSAEALLPGPGSFVLEVRDGNNDARSSEPYDFSIFAG